MKPEDLTTPAATMVLRTLDVLEAMTAAQTALSLSQLALQLGLPKSTMLRILQALEQRRYVIRDPVSKAYLCGAMLWPANPSGAHRALIAAAKWFLHALATGTGETSHLAILETANIIYLDVVEPTTRVRAWISPGETAPGNCVASGKAILASSPPDLVARWLAGPLVRVNDQSIAEPDRLKRALDRTRRLGYATNHGEWEPEIFGLSAPVIGPFGYAIAAIGISGPASRFNGDRVKFLAPLVVKQAGYLSNLLQPPAADKPATRKRKNSHA